MICYSFQREDGDQRALKYTGWMMPVTENGQRRSPAPYYNFSEDYITFDCDDGKFWKIDIWFGSLWHYTLAKKSAFGDA